jgi:predicted cobalt transporter CbtA
MTARAFLIRGLLVGLLAGIATFLVAHQVGEPHVERAIALEESAGPVDEAADESVDGHAHSHAGEQSGQAQETTTVSRSTQRTWGLLTGSLAVGVALGGIVALVSAGVVGRLGRLTPAQSTAVVTLIGFVAFALVPFLKYPSNPPGVGSGETIGSRTSYYFVFVLISLVAAVASSVLAGRLWTSRGAYVAVVSGAALYIVAMVLAGQLMPTVNEVGDFPADTLWYFRLASLLTLATMWAAIGVALTGMVARLYRQTAATAARREFAESL